MLHEDTQHCIKGVYRHEDTHKALQALELALRRPGRHCNKSYPVRVSCLCRYGIVVHAVRAELDRV